MLIKTLPRLLDKESKLEKPISKQCISKETHQAVNVHCTCVITTEPPYSTRLQVRSTSKIIVIGHCNRSNNGDTFRHESLPSLSTEPINLSMQICSMSSFQWMAE